MASTVTFCNSTLNKQNKKMPYHPKPDEKAQNISARPKSIKCRLAEPNLLRRYPIRHVSTARAERLLQRYTQTPFRLPRSLATPRLDPPQKKTNTSSELPPTPPPHLVSTPPSSKHFAWTTPFPPAPDTSCRTTHTSSRPRTLAASSFRRNETSAHNPPRR